jgi:hypothetical protein
MTAAGGGAQGRTERLITPAHVKRQKNAADAETICDGLSVAYNRHILMPSYATAHRETTTCAPTVRRLLIVLEWPSPRHSKGIWIRTSHMA